MTMDEKFQYFYKISVGSARKEEEQELAACREELSAMFAAHREAKLRQAKEERDSEALDIKRQISRSVFNEQLLVRRRLLKEEEEWKARLFSEVEQLLADFRRSEEYEDYLCRKYQEALDFAGKDEIRLLLSEGDAVHAPALEERLGHSVEVLTEDFGGGTRALIPSRSVRIDGSFAALLEEERAEFSLEGGQFHE